MVHHCVHVNDKIVQFARYKSFCVTPVTGSLKVQVIVYVFQVVHKPLPLLVSSTVGLLLSQALAVNLVYQDIVTVVLALFELAGEFQLFVVQFENVYQFSGVAEMLTCFQYLYVHAQFTELIHVHATSSS
jgi:hypothetical protein